MLSASGCVMPSRSLSPTGDSTRYISRWRQILEAYNRVRARLFNSLELLEGTDLALFVINEATLLRWFKLQERRKEEGLSFGELHNKNTTNNQPL